MWPASATYADCITSWSAEAVKPNGKRYTNTEEDWNWLGKAAKAARWLGYVGFNQIIERNDEPVIRRLHPQPPRAIVTVGMDVVIPEAEDLVPTVELRDFIPVQPYRLVLIGEKSSLRPVLDPIAERYGADLYLPTGEISDTQIYMMASDGYEDGQPMVVLYFADCDPSGYQMAISVSRKLQALHDLEFDELDFQVHQVALTPAPGPRVRLAMNRARPVGTVWRLPSGLQLRGN